ncbi:MAG: hypothetical protein Q8Q37_02340 [bacterium]|nr:hypothetical protein [bacterium]
MDINYSGKQSRKRRLWFRIKLYLISGGFLLVLLLVFYISQSSFFRIDKIEISGLRSFTETEFLNNLKPVVLNSYLAGALGFNNYIVWLKDIKYDHPAIIKIDTETNFTNKTLKLEVYEREPYGIWCASKETICHWFDREGVVFARSPATEGFLLYKINGPLPNNEDLILAFKRLGAALDVLNQNKVLVRSINFDDKSQELTIETYERAKIILSLRFDVSDLLVSAIESVVKKVGLDKINYIDLTVENRIYYK